MPEVQGPHETRGDGHGSEEHREISRIDQRAARAPHSRAQSRTALLGKHRAAPQSVRQRGVATSRESTGTDDGPPSLRPGFVRALPLAATAATRPWAPAAHTKGSSGSAWDWDRSPASSGTGWRATG